MESLSHTNWGRLQSKHPFVFPFLLQYILSGSDDFNLYMWKIPKDPEAGELLDLTAPMAYLCLCAVILSRIYCIFDILVQQKK